MTATTPQWPEGPEADPTAAVTSRHSNGRDLVGDLCQDFIEEVLALNADFYNEEVDAKIGVLVQPIERLPKVATELWGHPDHRARVEAGGVDHALAHVGVVGSFDLVLDHDNAAGLVLRPDIEAQLDEKWVADPRLTREPDRLPDQRHVAWALRPSSGTGSVWRWLSPGGCRRHSLSCCCWGSWLGSCPRPRRESPALTAAQPSPLHLG